MMRVTQSAASWACVSLIHWGGRALRSEFLVGLGEGVVSADVAGEDDVGEAGVAGFVSDGPDGDAGEDLAEDHGLFDAEGIGGDIGGGDAAFCDEEAGAGDDGLDEGNEGAGDGLRDGEVFRFAGRVDAVARGEEDGGFSGLDGLVEFGGKGEEGIVGVFEEGGDIEFERDSVGGVFDEVRELGAGLGNVGAHDDEAAVGVGVEVLHLPRIERRAADDAREGLHEGGGGADDEAAVAF